MAKKLSIVLLSCRKQWDPCWLSEGCTSLQWKVKSQRKKNSTYPSQTKEACCPLMKISPFLTYKLPFCSSCSLEAAGPRGHSHSQLWEVHQWSEAPAPVSSGAPPQQKNGVGQHWSRSDWQHNRRVWAGPAALPGEEKNVLKVFPNTRWLDWWEKMLDLTSKLTAVWREK